MTSIKSGFIWSSGGRIAQYTINFVSGIVMARLLDPKDYGLLGLLAVFINLTTLVVDSGYRDALIRNTRFNANKDFTAVFFFNLFMSIFLYAVLFFLAPVIASYYSQPVLINITRVAFIAIIINSLSIVQITKLQIDINFKLQAKIDFVITIIGTIIGIVMAATGFGVWSLVIPGLLGAILRSILLFLFVKWRPEFPIQFGFLRTNFSFSLKLLINRISESISTNLIQLLIGKFYSIQAVGYYTKAFTFYALPNGLLSTTINEVSYPVFARASDIERKSLLKKMVRFTAMISFPLSFGLIIVAKPMILVLLGEKWAQSIPILQVLALIISVMSLNYMNNALIKLAGKVNLLLWSSLLKNLIIIVLLIAVKNQGILTLCFVYVIVNVLVYLLYAYNSGKYTGYLLKEQLSDVLPSFICALVMAAGMYLSTFLDINSMFLQLIVYIIIGFLIINILYAIFLKKEYKFLLNILKKKSNVK
jgi:O-antigen/teichoic acid export membrane protein